MRPEAQIAELWQSPDKIASSTRLIANALARVDEEANFDQIVITSKVAPFMGIEPLSGNLSVPLNKGLVFWRESSGLLTVKPRIIGSLSAGQRVVVTDSITYPGSVRDIVGSLVETGYTPVAFMSLCCLDENAQEEVERSAQEFHVKTLKYYPPEFTFSLFAPTA